MVLLTNVSFDSAYHGVSLFPVTAGLSTINASVADQSTTNLAAVTLASYYRSILLDSIHVIHIPPLTIKFQFLNILTSFLSIVGTEDRINEEAFHGLRSLMYIPVMLYNNMVLGDGPSPSDIGKSATVAIPSYGVYHIRCAHYSDDRSLLLAIRCTHF